MANLVNTATLELTGQLADGTLHATRETISKYVEDWAKREAKKDPNRAEHIQRCADLIIKVSFPVAELILKQMIQNARTGKGLEASDLRGMIGDQVSKYGHLIGMGVDSDRIIDLTECIGGIISLNFYVIENAPKLRQAVGVVRIGLAVSGSGAMVVLGGTITVSAGAYILFIVARALYDAAKTANACSQAVGGRVKPVKVEGSADSSMVRELFISQQEPSRRMSLNRGQDAIDHGKVFSSRQGNFLLLNATRGPYSLGNPLGYAAQCLPGGVGP